MTATMTANASLDISKLLDKLDATMKTKHMAAALAEAAKIVVADAVRRVPRSSETGTRDGNSKAYKQKHGDPPKPLWKTIGFVGRSYKQGYFQFAAVGAERPAGSHGHLVEHGHKMVLWGRGYAKETRKIKRTKEVLSALQAAQAGKRGRRVAAEINVSTVKGGIQGFVQAKKWLAPAGDSTRGQQENAVIQSLSKAAEAETRSA